MPGTTFDIDVIAAGARGTRRLPDGGLVYARGERGDCAYIITRGRVRVGNGVPIEILDAGEIFGETALLDDGPRSAAAVAVGPTEVVEIGRSVFDALIRDDPDFALTIMRLMVRRLRATISALDRAAGHGRPELRALA